jgi:Asp-tRNA(Asn)/Glu-tRNA(Gln) amidotransferase C subunit
MKSYALYALAFLIVPSLLSETLAWTQHLTLPEQRKNSRRISFATNDVPRLDAPAATPSAMTRTDFSKSFARILLVSAASSATAILSPRIVNAVVMDSSNTPAVFSSTGQPMTVQEAKDRLIEARKSLGELVDNYDEIAKGGGDNVRRYLGTVGVKSGLYGINRVLKTLQEEANDIVEYTENLNEFDYSLRAADTAVYSANFVEYSSAKTKPEKFFEDARIEINRMQVYLDEMIAQLDLK